MKLEYQTTSAHRQASEKPEPAAGWSCEPVSPSASLVRGSKLHACFCESVPAWLQAQGSFLARPQS